MPYHAPNGFVYSSKKAYLKSLKAMHFLSPNQISSKRPKKKQKRMRPRVELKKTKYQKVLSNQVGTASNTEDIKVVESVNEVEDRRKIQSNIIHIEDDDANVRIDIIDRQNALKPKRAKNIITEEYQGDKVITEYGSDGKKVAETHVQVSNIRPLETERTPKQLQKLTASFEGDMDTLTVAQLKRGYDLATLRVLGDKVYNTGKPKTAQKDEKQWYIKNIRSVRAVRQLNERQRG